MSNVEIVKINEHIPTQLFSSFLNFVCFITKNLPLICHKRWLSVQLWIPTVQKFR